MTEDQLDILKFNKKTRLSYEQNIGNNSTYIGDNEINEAFKDIICRFKSCQQTSFDESLIKLF